MKETKKRTSCRTDRCFKIDGKNRCLILLFYCLIYILYISSDFLLDMTHSNVYIDIQKFESLVRGCLPIPKNIQNNNKTEDAMKI